MLGDLWVVMLVQEDMYSYVTVADNQVFAGQGTKIVESQ